jgi:hypothetical protein
MRYECVVCQGETRVTPLPPDSNIIQTRISNHNSLHMVESHDADARLRT